MAKWLQRDEGQTMAEYGVVLAVISAGVLTALLFFADGVRSALEKTIALMP